MYWEWPTCRDKINDKWSTQAKTSFEQEHKADEDSQVEQTQHGNWDNSATHEASIEAPQGLEA